MDAAEPVQSRSKRDLVEHMDGRQSRYDDDDDRDNVERKRHRSGKLSRFNSTDVEEQDSGRRKSSGDKDEGRKKSGGLGQAESPNEDDYEVKRESRSKTARKNTVERSVMRSNEGYRGKDSEGSQKGVVDDYIDPNSSRKKNSSPGQESPECKGRNKVDNPPEGEAEKAQERESRYSDRKENSRERGHGQREQERNISSRRRWDDMGSWRKTDDGNYMDRSDPRSGKSSEQGSLRDRASDPRIDSGHTRGRTADSTGEKGGTCSNRDGKRDVERKRGLSEILGDDHREITETIRDDKLTKVRMRSPAVTEDMEWHSHSGKSHIEKGEKHKQQHDALHGSHDEVEIMERSDEDVQPRIRDKYGRNGRYNRSPSPEGSKRYPEDMEDRDRDQSESDTERNTAVRGKDSLKDNRDFRPSKGKDGSWNERNMDRESSKDYWRSQSKQDTKVVNEFDNIRGWDSQSYEPTKMDGDKLHFRPGYKKDNRVRSEGGRFENSDSIEIKPNHNLDFVNNVSVSTFPGRVAEVGSAQDSSGAANDDEWGYPTDDKAKVGYGSSDDMQEKFHDGVDSSSLDQISGRNSLDSQAGKGRGQKGLVNSSRIGQAPNSSSSSQAPFGYNQGSSSFNRISQQGQKGGKAIRGGRGRMTGRDAQRGGLPMHMMGPPFGHIGLPPGTMQSLGPNMPPSVGPPLGPGVFIPPFAGPLSWSAGRAVDINMLAAPPNLPPIPLGPAGPRFAPNMGAGPNQVMYFNQQSSGRINSNMSGPEFNANGPVVRETSNDKVPAVWGQSRTGGPSGKAPSRGEQNDYSQNFVDTGMRPQNFIRELELTSVVEDYPKLRELIQRKDDIVMNSSTPPLYYKTDLREFTLTPEFFGTKFDVILVDPPWEEYVHRAPGITDHIEYWTFEEIQNLKIEAIADTPSFIFLWVGDGAGLEQGRQCLKKWGFRRCEDICWVKTNKKNATPGLRHDSHTLFQHSKEHCLMGIKGTVRRSTDGHIIHANIDTDIIISDEPPDGSTKKPDDMYRIIEHFSLGRRRLELFGEDHNIRPGWLTLGKDLTSSNFDAGGYLKNFIDKDGKVWQGGGGRNPPPDAPHLVATTPEIESLRPKSPPQKSQQPPSIPLVSNSSNRRPLGSSPQNPSVSSVPILNQDASTSESGALAPPWFSSTGGFRELESSHMGIGDKYDGYGLNATFGQVVGDHIEFDPQRAVHLNMM